MLDVVASRKQARARLPVKPPEHGELQLADGTRLVATIWRPDTAETLPVLLMRQPYGREIASTVTLAHPSWYAAHGYVVVIQDVRGAGDSEGDFEALANEAEDGAQTLEWARNLPGSNGKIGTYGFSYQGTTQFLTLAGGGKPDAMAVAMASWNPVADWASEGGLFRTAMASGWAAQMARLKAHRLGDKQALRELAPGKDWTDYFTFLSSRPDLSHLPSWAKGDIAANPSVLLNPPPPVPLLQTAGAADLFLRGTLAADTAFRAVSPETTHLIFAPWSHIGWNRSSGGARLEAGAEFSVDRAQLAFFDHYLKGLGETPAALRAYDAGTDDWREVPLADLRDPASRHFALSSDGLAATLLSDGRLCEPFDAESEEGFDVIVHDPLKPAPLVGGVVGTPPGPVDTGAHDDRADVACYTTDPFAHAQTLIGQAAANLSVRIDGNVTALGATLALVTAEGASIALATTVAPVEAGRCRLTFEGLCRTLKPGEALRLAIQVAPCPQFLPYPALDLPEPGVRAATVTLCHQASEFLLPMKDLGQSDA